MKKIMILILLAACINASKAQELIPLKPELKLTDSLNKSFNLNDYLSPKALLLQPVQTGNLSSINQNTRIVYSRMPVAVIVSNDHMPIAGEKQAGNQDNMPMASITVVDPFAKPEKLVP